MSSYVFETYRQETLELARTLTIKFDIQNTLVNARLTDLGQEISETDKKTWKYYLNLNGQYHRNDRMMTVMSSDTQEEITFDKETLESHPRTRLEYAKGGIYYNQLLERYPTQVILINGITDPVDMDFAINAPDFTILRHDASKLAPNETRVISDLQKWIYRFASRYFIRDFYISDPLYPAAFFASLKFWSLAELFNIRLSYARTDKAPQFHVWNYLASNFKMDKYRGILDHQQVMWLYRNLTDIRKHAGRRDRFEDMRDYLLAPAGVKMEALEFIQRTEGMEETGKPTPSFTFVDYDKKEIDYSSGSFYGVRGAYELTEELGVSNLAEQEDDISDADYHTRAIAQARLPTGLVRAYEANTTAAQNYDLNIVKVQYWAYLSSFNIFNPKISIQLPNDIPIEMTLRDAFVLFIFALDKAHGRKKKYVPEVELKGIVPLAYPTAAQLRKLAPYNYISDKEIDDILNDKIEIMRVKTRIDFNKMVNRIVDRWTKQELWWEAKPTSDGMSIAQDVCMGTWGKVTCKFTKSGTLFTDWLAQRRINDASINEYEWHNIAREILTKAIDAPITDADMSTVQHAVINIIDRLSSYNVAIIRSGSGAKYRNLEIPNFKLDRVSANIVSKYEVAAGLNTLDILMESSITAKWNDDAGEKVERIDAVNANFLIQEGVDFTITDNRTLTRTFENANTRITYEDE